MTAAANFFGLAGDLQEGIPHFLQSSETGGDMSTTTIRLPGDLEARIAVAADRAGTSPPNFILQTIAKKTALEQRRATFQQEADRRYGGIVTT